MTTLFAELEYYQKHKDGEDICGDAFRSQKLADENRVVAVLSDGLGSGVKANVLATMTSAMALKFVVGNMEITRSAGIMMQALPVCSVRRISYATFTIVDTTLHGSTRIIEMGNPPFLFLRGGKAIEMPRTEISSPGWKDRTMAMAEFAARAGDRIVFFSDGISQSGMGTPMWPLGWREEGCQEFIEKRIADEPHISARKLAREVVHEAIRKEQPPHAGDDMTCAVLYLREPRRLLLLSGPPFDGGRDAEYAGMLDSFDGKRVVCGGTTANIVARELDREITTELRGGGGLPPPSKMQGADLITKGILTLTRAARILEGENPETGAGAASQLVDLLRESDVIDFVIGTRINEAHQDPTLPVDLEIRRNIIKRIAKALEDKYLKEVRIQYI